MRNLFISLLCAAAAVVAACGSLFAQAPLPRLARTLDEKWRLERTVAESIASVHRIPVRIDRSDGSSMELQRFEHGIPLLYRTYNLTSAKTISTDKVWTGSGFGFALSGSTDTIGEWDAAAVLTTHQEFGGRVLSTQGSSTGTHSTHVAGTLIAAGVVANAHGMSFQGYLRSYDWNNDLAEMALAASRGLRVSNHSYGFITGWDYNLYGDGKWEWFGDPTISGTQDYRFGFYDDAARSWDSVAAAAPYYLIAVAAGNDRGEGPSSQPISHWEFDSTGARVLSTAFRPIDGGSTGYRTLNGAGNSKDILVVGAVNPIPNGYQQPGDVVMTSFSCWGPTDDGRVKPDVVADGVNLYSTSDASNTSYTTMSGTSMATPSVAGSVGLLLQHQRDLHGNHPLRASTMRGIIIHTADDAGLPGPDYSYGWGLMNTLHAAQLMSLDSIDGPDSHIREIQILNGDSATITVYSTGTQPLKATICWTDPPGISPPPSLNPPDIMLVNDMDLRIIRDSDQKIYFPWTLDGANPSGPAVTGDNVRDNVEQIVLPSPSPGAYALRITHKGSLQGGSQIVSVIVTGNVMQFAPVARAAADSLSFAVNPGTVSPESTRIFNDGTIDLTYTPSAHAPWLVLDTTSGTVAPGSSSVIKFSINAASLSQWSRFRDTMVIVSNDTAHSPLGIPIILSTMGPRAMYRPAFFALVTDTGQSVSDTLHIRNAGTLPLRFNITDADSIPRPWLSIGRDTGTVVPGDSIGCPLIFNATALPQGNYSASLRIVHNDSSSPPGIIPITLGVVSGTIVTTTVGNNWNIVSLPVIPLDTRKSVLYPTALSDAFAYQGTYAVAESLQPGWGYWMKFDGVQTIPIGGLPMSQDSVTAAEGWNLIGSITQPVAAAGLLSDPPGIMLPGIFKYAGGYSFADTIVPGSGYWVKTTQAGRIIIASLMEQNPKKAAAPVLSGFDRLTIRDDRGGCQSLYIEESAGTNATGSTELPPVPPPGSFDARFKSGKYLESMAPGDSRAIRVALPSASSRAAVAWEIRPTDPAGYTLADRSGHQWGLTGKGDLNLPTASSDAFELLLARPQRGLPLQFALEQNYPNPFNPATDIRYRISETRFVVLRVYDLLGREIATLVNEPKPPGDYVVRWNAEGISSGVYFYRLLAGSFSASRMMCLMR